MRYNPSSVRHQEKVHQIGRRGKELNLLPLPCAGSALPVSYAPGKLKRITVRYSIVRGYRETRPYQLAAPLGASLAIAPSHFRRPTAASVAITGTQIPNDRIQRRDPRDRKGPSAPCRCGNARDDRQRATRRAG